MQVGTRGGCGSLGAYGVSETARHDSRKAAAPDQAHALLLGVCTVASVSDSTFIQAPDSCVNAADSAELSPVFQTLQLSECLFTDNQVALWPLLLWPLQGLAVQ
jgi:hypothetical protein